MMVGNQVPYNKRHNASPQDVQTWKRRKEGFGKEAARGIRSEEALAYVKHPGWEWHGDATKS